MEARAEAFFPSLGSQVRFLEGLVRLCGAIPIK